MSSYFPEVISFPPQHGLTSDILARMDSDPVQNVLTIPAPLSGRTPLRGMFMGRQCMAFECMREAMSACGIEADFCSIEQQITKQAWNYDVFVMFLTKCGPGLATLIQQRMNELRACMPDIPAMALLEDANAYASTLDQLGFSTIIIGLPSLNFAVTAIRLLSLGATAAKVIDEDATERVNEAVCPNNPEPGQAGDVRAVMLGDVSFTKREFDLIELLRSGMQNKVIAHRLGISESTVKAHLRNIMTKLHAKNRTQAIVMLSAEMMRKTTFKNGEGGQIRQLVRNSKGGHHAGMVLSDDSRSFCLGMSCLGKLGG